MKALKVLSVLGLTFILVACGIFNKTKKVEKTRVKKEKTEFVIEQKGVTVQQKELDTEFTELIIRMPKDKAVVQDSLVNEYETLQGAIVQAIRNSETTTLRRRTTRSNQSDRVDTSRTERNVTQSLDSLKQESDLNKQSNTTLAANIPWFAWPIGFGLVFLMVYFILKRYRVL